LFPTGFRRLDAVIALVSRSPRFYARYALEAYPIARLIHRLISR